MEHTHIICEKMYNCLYNICGRDMLHNKINQYIESDMGKCKYAKQYNNKDFSFEISIPQKMTDKSQVNILRYNPTFQHIITKLFYGARIEIKQYKIII